MSITLYTEQDNGNLKFVAEVEGIDSAALALDAYIDENPRVKDREFVAVTGEISDGVVERLQVPEEAEIVQPRRAIVSTRDGDSAPAAKKTAVKTGRKPGRKPAAAKAEAADEEVTSTHPEAAPGAPYGFKADGTPRLRPGPGPRKGKAAAKKPAAKAAGAKPDGRTKAGRAAKAAAAKSTGTKVKASGTKIKTGGKRSASPIKRNAASED